MMNQYITLFKEVSNMASILAEQVMDYNKEHNDDTGYKTASLMHNDYIELYNKLSDSNCEPLSLTKNEYIKLLAATMIVVSNIEERIKAQQKTVEGYKTILIPKLDALISNNKEKEDITEEIKQYFYD